MKRSLFLFSAWAVLSASALSFRVAAQTAPPSSHATPSPEQMIEQLKAPRTRSLRNLTVEAVSPVAATSTSAAATVSSVAAALPPAVSEPRPSLSLLIQFDFDSARVQPVSQGALANLALAMKSKELQDSKFAIEGHTDAKGRVDYNQRLSQLRADAVRDLLVNQGVKNDRLKAQGKGSSELALPASPEAAANRRVRIVNLD
jgi:outer membrane protein OmpA-like peptidoglycan-associated protein